MIPLKKEMPSFINFSDTLKECFNSKKISIIDLYQFTPCYNIAI